jgi:serine/threonine protein kinase
LIYPFFCGEIEMIGKTLVHYEISAEIGKGGMGEVYQAKDTKLGRDVAIKVLPEEFALDKDRVARFQREAKLLASLNHPNIAAIYGLEESEGIHFLVMELIEGDTLRDRIKSGPIPVEEALKLALQMAEALEAAHEKGVIHRDLKPANIKVTPDGKVKILDFGLAKAYVGDQGNVNLADSPTISAAATQQGVILGTAAYMSPEQARGKPVDRRADIWAFGVVLFEMLTGKSLFSGEDVTSTVARVLEREPDFSTLPTNLHSRIRFMLERCLKKDRKDRYSAISDARVDIQSVFSDPKGIFAQPGETSELPQKQRAILPWVTVTAIICLIIAGVAVWMLKPVPPPEPKQVVRFDYELSAVRQFTRYTMPNLAVSPDGNKSVFCTKEGLYLRFVDSLDARLIPGTDINSYQPFFSPDSQSIAYFSGSDRKLKKVNINGVAPIVLCDTSDTSIMSGDGYWHTDNTILYADTIKGIMRVSADGGIPEVLVKVDTSKIIDEGFLVAPQMLPDGKTLLFTKTTQNGSISQILLHSFESGEQKVLINDGRAARYLPTGHIVYTLLNSNIRNLLSVSFDLDRLEVTGGAVSILEDVREAAFSENGTLVYVPQAAGVPGSAGPTSSDNVLVWVDRQGREEPLGSLPDAYRNVKISPDGTRVALIIERENADIWIWDIPHSTPTKLTFDKAAVANPIWTPDSKKIVFTIGSTGGLGGVYWKSADGIGEPELLAAKPDGWTVPWSFSRDGKICAVYEVSLSPLNIDVGMILMEGDREIKALLQEKHFENQPQISPNGRFLAYVSNESGKEEIYVRSFPDVNEGRWQVSSSGGHSPLWSPDGRALFYRSGDATMAVEVETGSAFKHEKPEILFQGTYLTDSSLRMTSTKWDIHPDGKKFLMIKSPTDSGQAETPALTRTIIVLNWFEELKQRVPVD